MWARQAKGWRQGQLAKALGISPAYMSELERGVRSAPPDLLNRISRLLGCPTTILEHRDPSDREAVELLAKIIGLVATREAA